MHTRHLPRRRCRRRHKNTVEAIDIGLKVNPHATALRHIAVWPSVRDANPATAAISQDHPALANGKVGSTRSLDLNTRHLRGARLGATEIQILVTHKVAIRCGSCFIKDDPTIRLPILDLAPRASHANLAHVALALAKVPFRVRIHSSWSIFSFHPFHFNKHLRCSALPMTERPARLPFLPTKLFISCGSLARSNSISRVGEWRSLVMMSL